MSAIEQRGHAFWATVWRCLSIEARLNDDVDLFYKSPVIDRARRQRRSLRILLLLTEAN